MTTYFSLGLHMEWHTADEYECFSEINEVALTGCIFAGYFQEEDTKYAQLTSASLTCEITMSNLVVSSLFGEVATGKDAVLEGALMFEKIDRLCQTSLGRNRLLCALANVAVPEVES